MVSKVRYAVVGLGHIAQNAVLPSFKHATEKCELTALISDDADKIKKMSSLYECSESWSYDEYDDALKSGSFDAVYIALPNEQHKDFAVRAANAGIHVLCEKPMAITHECCQEMISAAEKNGVKLMIAYRLHFETTNMEAVQAIRNGEIGEPRIFNSTFCMQVRENNIRTQLKHGGGPLYDIGIYCINAARYLFKSEPFEVSAFSVKGDDKRFSEIDESVGAIMKFPNNQIAVFACSFGASDVGHFEVIGTKGSLKLDPAFEYVGKLSMSTKRGDAEKRFTTPAHDQFAPELLYFAECIQNDQDPRPSGYEGQNDVRIIEALQESISSGNVVKLDSLMLASEPDKSLVKEKPANEKPPLVKVKSAST